VERQTSIEHGSQHLHIVGYWQIGSCHRHRWHGWRDSLNVRNAKTLLIVSNLQHWMSV